MPAQEMVGTAAQWAQFGAMGLVCLMLFGFLGLGARWLLGYVTRRDERYAEESRYRDTVFANSLSAIMLSHEKTSASIVTAVDRLAQEVRENGSHRV